jgi:hypothetical protein
MTSGMWQKALVSLCLGFGVTRILRFRPPCAVEPDLQARPSAYLQHSFSGTNVLEKSRTLVPPWEQAGYLGHDDLFQEARLNGTSTPPRVQAVRFWDDPDAVVQLFQDCHADHLCHIAYHHVPKTGGTTMEVALHAIFGQRQEDSCCNERMMERLETNPKHYCEEKFSSWQVHAPDFFAMMHRCFRRVKNQRRALVVVTLRDPVSLLLSYIHQRCNKNWESRSAAVQQACRVCRYENSTQEWDKVATLVTRQLQGAWQVARLQTNITSIPVDAIQVVLLEPVDLNSFLKKWQPHREFPIVNAEALTRCNFQPTQALVDRMAVAQTWYRRLVANV